MDQTHVDTLEHPGMFDRFAVWSANLVSRAPFFAFCVLLVVAWAPTYPLVGNFDTWQLLINTPTTILTFLLVAVLQNSQRRGEQALQTKPISWSTSCRATRTRTPTSREMLPT